MTPKKNEVLRLLIEDMSAQGSGIGRADGFPLFVPNAITGDIVSALVVKAKKTYGFAKLLEVIEPSPSRRKAPCPVASRCGGCRLQEMEYAAQLAFKKKRVADCLERIAGIRGATVHDAIPSKQTYHYRNKAQIPVGHTANGGLISGFYAPNSHNIVPADGCLLGSALQDRARAIVMDWMRKNAIAAYNESTGRGQVRHILLRETANGRSLMVCIVANRPDRLKNIDRLVCALTVLPQVSSILINENSKKTNVILGERTKVLYGDGHITDTIGGMYYRISARSFFQVNRYQTGVLYGEVLKAADLTGSEVVWDLYCGTGTISLFLAKNAKWVHGVEVEKSAIEDARANMALNGIKNADFTLGAAQELLPELFGGGQPAADVIVVDPPRSGCAPELLEVLLKVGVPKIVYVSCDPSTLARDIKMLSEKYELSFAQPVDMFPQTAGVETVVRLVQK